MSTENLLSPLHSDDKPDMSIMFKYELANLFKHSYHHISLEEFLRSDEVLKLVNSQNETDDHAMAKLRLATELLKDIFTYVLPEHTKPHRIEVWRDKIDELKSKWPCHGLPDYINNIMFEVGSNGDLVDFEYFKIDPSGEEIAESWDSYSLDAEVDGAFISALFDDAKKFCTFKEFGGSRGVSPIGYRYDNIHYYGKEESVR